jgi:hypothetical protein
VIRRLLPLVGVLIAITSTAARAETPGLTTIGTRLDTGETCWTTTIEHLTLTWGGGPIGDCPADRVQLTLTGSVWSPGPNAAWFAASDDGLRITIDGTLVVDAWYDRACSGGWFYPALPAGWHDITIDYYENGGYTCLYLGRDAGDGFRWLEAQDLRQDTPETTTTAPATTSTEPTTTSSTTSTAPPEMTTLPPTTTTVPAPVITYQDSTTSTTSSTTSTTTIPWSTGSPSSTQPTQEATTPSTVQSTTIPAATTPAATTIATTIPPGSLSTTTTVAPPPPTAAEALTAVLAGELDDATAGDLFAAIDENDLTAAQGAALVAAVQDASPTVRAAFEKNINIFAGVTDNYVPLGSRVPVSTRRVIIITTGLLVAMPTTTRRRP